jgi:hypothetical protein
VRFVFFLLVTVRNNVDVAEVYRFECIITTSPIILLELLICKLNTSQLHSFFHSSLKSIVFFILHYFAVILPFFGLLLHSFVPTCLLWQMPGLNDLSNYFWSTPESIHFGLVIVFIDIENITSFYSDILEVLSISVPNDIHSFTSLFYLLKLFLLNSFIPLKFLGLFVCVFCFIVRFVFHNDFIPLRVWGDEFGLVIHMIHHFLFYMRNRHSSFASCNLANSSNR